MNKAILMGRLTRDPEVRYSQNNLPITNFTLAIDRRFTRQGEERQADFIPIVSFGKTAEFCEKYYRKGQQVLVVGRIQTRTWDDNEGKRRYVTEVICEEAYFADSKRQDGGGGGRQDDYGYYPQAQSEGPQSPYGVGQQSSPYGAGARAIGGTSSSAYGGNTGATPTFGGGASAPPAYGGSTGVTPASGGGAGAVQTFGGGAAATPAFGGNADAAPANADSTSPVGDGTQAKGTDANTGTTASSSADDGFVPIENESDLPF